VSGEEKYADRPRGHKQKDRFILIIKYFSFFSGETEQEEKAFVFIFQPRTKLQPV